MALVAGKDLNLHMSEVSKQDVFQFTGHTTRTSHGEWFKFKFQVEVDVYIFCLRKGF